MKRLIIIAVSLIMFLVLQGILYSKLMQKSVHLSIQKEDIADIEVYGSGGTKKIEDVALIDNIIMWFNQLSDIRVNKDFEGTTPESGIIINLKSGKKISILNSGSDFEIQRNDVRPENVSYWGKQQDIKAYLQGLIEGSN